MKANLIQTLIKSAIFAVAFAGVAQAATSTQNATWSLTTSAQSFTFNQFNSALGTLTAIDLILNSSTPGGSVSITTDGDNALFSSLTSKVRVSGTGFVQNTSSDTAVAFTPGLPNTQPASTTQAYAVNGGQSLLSNRTISITLDASYSGTGSTNAFTARTFTTQTLTSDGSPSFNAAAYLAGTSVTLRYTYTVSGGGGPASVPEPRQVAASLLVLGGIGGYAFMKRKKAPVAV